MKNTKNTNGKWKKINNNTLQIADSYMNLTIRIGKTHATITHTDEDGGISEDVPVEMLLDVLRSSGSLK